MHPNTTNALDPHTGYPMYPSSTDHVTGSQKVYIKQQGDQVTTEQKSSYHNPITGVSEKQRMTTKRDRSRSRSTSSQRRRRNLPYQQQVSPPLTTQIPTSTQPINRQISPYNQPPYNQPINTTNPFENQPLNPQISSYSQNQSQGTNMPVTSNTAVNTDPQLSNIPVTHQTVQYTSPPDIYARDQGKIKTTDTKIQTTQTLTYKNPITGTQQNAKIQTKIVGPDTGKGKTKSTYDHKTQQTVNGPKTQIKQTHRQGSILTNIKNKISNMFR